MTTRRMSRDGRLQDDAARYREAVRDAELAERIAEQAAEGPRGPHTRADEHRAATFARQRGAATPDAPADPPAAAGEAAGRDRTVVQISATRRTRVRRG